jgi:endoglucanase
MTAVNDPSFRPVLEALHGPLSALRDGQPMPEKVNTLTGTREGTGNYGFEAALVPYLQAQGETDRAKALAAALPTPEQQRAAPPRYYEQVLSLFALGWYEGRYRFAADGQLRPSWV